MDITAVPRTPAFVKGVINLRGQVISVIDLRTKFGMEAPQRDRRDVHHRRRDPSAGAQALDGHHRRSRVSEVLNIAAENIEEPPTFGAGRYRLHPGHGEDRAEREDPARHRPGVPPVKQATDIARAGSNRSDVPRNETDA